jgi:cytochrome c oxidase subunit 1
MATTTAPPDAATGRGSSDPRTSVFTRIVGIITSTDHKTVGYLYITTAFLYFCLAGVLALVIRAQLFEPGMEILQTKDQYNQLFTMHGTIMMLFFATPLFAGFANIIMPLQIGAPDVAFPRLNAFSYWLFFFGAGLATGALLLPQGSAQFGWTAYTPLSTTTFSPGDGGDLWVIGLAITGFSTIFGGVNFITTIVTMRAPGMTMFRMPIFTWNILVTSILVLMAFPVLAAALFALAADRLLGAHV